jgi:hypothetical protein
MNPVRRGNRRLLPGEKGFVTQTGMNVALSNESVLKNVLSTAWAKCGGCGKSVRENFEE